MNIQKTGWGEIRWQDEKTTILKNRKLQVGEVRLYAGNHQAKHLHYDEQVMYCLAGEAVSAINGEKEILRPGDCRHYPAGVDHEVWNEQEVPFVHLLISRPMNVGADIPFSSRNDMEENAEFQIQEDMPQGTENEGPDKDNGSSIDPGIFYVAVEAVRNQFLDNLNYSYAIFDSMGNLVLQSSRFPQHCLDKCNPGDRQGACPCMRTLSLEECRQQNIITCPYKMEVLHNPVFFRGRFLGYIQGGFFRHSGQADESDKVYDVPESVVVGVGALLRRIVKAIRNYCEFEQFRQELEQKEMQLATETQKQSMMLTDLRKAQTEVTDLKINNHFLFNSLNQMASLAVEGGQMELYQSIVNLSKMFHYTLRTQSQLVPLQKEIEYVDAYLQLQKLRYREGLFVEKDISPEILDYQVPFNFLQPIVENAFIHGFNEESRKWLRIEGRRLESRGIEKDRSDRGRGEAGRKEEGIMITVTNSGKSLAEGEIRMINRAIQSNISHGLAMIWQKLTACTGGNASLEAGLDSEGNTCFKLMIKEERVNDQGNRL